MDTERESNPLQNNAAAKSRNAFRGRKGVCYERDHHHKKKDFDAIECALDCCNLVVRTDSALNALISYREMMGDVVNGYEVVFDDRNGRYPFDFFMTALTDEEAKRYDLA